jgi:hypothetical protein
MKRFIVGMLVLVAATSAPTARAAEKSLRLGHAFLLNGVVVEPGEYKVELAPSLDAVKLVRGKHVVASAPCRVSLTDGPTRADEVYSRPDSLGRDEIVRLMLADTQMAIEMQPSVGIVADGERETPATTGATR